MYTPSLSDRVNLRPALGVGRWGSRTRDHTALKTTSKPTNEWDTSLPTEGFLILTQCSRLPQKVFVKDWAERIEAQGHFLSSSPWVALLHQKPLWRLEEFLLSRSTKMEGCRHSWAGIRVEPLSFLYIFPFLLLLPCPPSISTSPSRGWRAEVWPGCMWESMHKVQRMHLGPSQGTDCTLWVIWTQQPC